MLQQLWRYFETTGDITMYLSFKDYENEYNDKFGSAQSLMHTDEVG